jgi:hypothetical protein
LKQIIKRPPFRSFSPLKIQDKIKQHHVDHDGIKAQEIFIKTDTDSAQTAPQTGEGAHEHPFISILLLGMYPDIETCPSVHVQNVHINKHQWGS